MNQIGSKLSDHSFLPDFCSIYGIFILVLIAQALAFLLELASYRPPEPYWSGLGLRSLFVQWVALGSAGTLCLLRRLTANLKPKKLAIMVFVVIQLVTLAISVLVYWGISEQLGLDIKLGSEAEFYLRNLAVSGIIVAILLHYLYIQYRWKQQEQASMEAKLEALQSRIRPHFLFNSLNTIASLTRSNPKLAEELVQDLAELFRASLIQNRRFVPIKDELLLVRQYLNIELQRLDGRLEIEWKTEGIPGNALVPPLTLQPLVENAVYHGVEPAESGGKICIEGTLSNSMLVLTVKNTLPADGYVEPRKGNRMAIENIRARIRGCFPEHGQVMISTANELYQVRLVIPYITD